jgi:hypothetical protein
VGFGLKPAVSTEQATISFVNDGPPITVEAVPVVMFQGHVRFTHGGREIARGDLRIDLTDVDPKYHGPIIHLAQMVPGASIPLGIFFEPPPKPRPVSTRLVREGDTGTLSWWGRLARRIWPRAKAGRLSTATTEGGELTGADT